jgi:hypothetical protein
MKNTSYNVPKSEEAKIVSVHAKGKNGTISVAPMKPPYENVTVKIISPGTITINYARWFIRLLQNDIRFYYNFVNARLKKVGGYFHPPPKALYRFTLVSNCFILISVRSMRASNTSHCVSNTSI